MKAWLAIWKRKVRLRTFPLLFRRRVFLQFCTVFCLSPQSRIQICDTRLLAVLFAENTVREVFSNPFCFLSHFIIWFIIVVPTPVSLNSFKWKCPKSQYAIPAGFPLTSAIMTQRYYTRTCTMILD